MSTDIARTDELSDLQAVADAVAARKPVDSEVARRVRERSQEAQQLLREQFGVREIAVDLIRQGRGE